MEKKIEERTRGMRLERSGEERTRLPTKRRELEDGKEWRGGNLKLERKGEERT